MLGLARSDASAAALEAKGATVLRGDLDDLDALRKGAADADGVVHLANKHDWSNPAASNAAERAAVEAIAETLVDTRRPFVLASGVAGLAPGRPATEEDRSPFHGPDSPRGGSENLALEYVERGVRTVSARFAPTVHGDRDHGFIARCIVAAAATRACPRRYVGDGTNRWSAVHRSDAARLVRLGLEQAPAGSLLHGVAEEGVPTKAIAEAIGRGLGLPWHVDRRRGRRRPFRVRRLVLRDGPGLVEHAHPGVAPVGADRPHPHRRHRTRARTSTERPAHLWWPRSRMRWPGRYHNGADHHPAEGVPHEVRGLSRSGVAPASARRSSTW